MEDLKLKFLDFINKQNRNVKMPSMGFSDLFMQHVSPTSETNEPKLKDDTVGRNENNLSDQEVLEGIEGIYFDNTENISTYELKKLTDEQMDCDKIQEAMKILKMQQKVISKKVLQNILEQSSACNEEFQRVIYAEKELEEALWVCRKARSCLNYSKKHLTTTSLEILAAYRKREILLELLNSLNAIKKMKTTDTQLQKLLCEENYSGGISLLLECKATANEYTKYKCVEHLSQKLQETLMLAEFQIDNVLNEMTQNFDVKKYAKLQEAYKLLNKSLIVMDQLHINFISSIHSTVNAVLRSYIDKNNEEKQKQLFEQLCESIPVDKYIPCLIHLCKSFWVILISYYQINMWHQNFPIFEENDQENGNEYILEKLKKGQSRIWNDIQSKLCTYLSSSKLIGLKFEQFIQVLSIIKRLKKVGLEFCGEPSNKLLDTMRLQSIQFFNKYHSSCLDEICLFLDHEAWVPVNYFTNIFQLQEFRSFKHLLPTYNASAIERKPLAPPSDKSNESAAQKNNCDESLSVHSQDGSSIYGSCGYFLRFSEKSSPFDGGLDASMIEEDILSGIIDEASCYFSEESDEGYARSSFISKCEEETQQDDVNLIANNTSLNVLRCIGKYLQMCKLLHSISPKIVASMIELIEFYVYAIHEIFGKDSVIPMENFYSRKLENKIKRLSEDVIPKVRTWASSLPSMINADLGNPETLYGLEKRLVAVESGFCMEKQFKQLRSYIEYLLPVNERQFLNDYFEDFSFISNVSKPVYMCVTCRVHDLPSILTAMSKVKWDVNHVSVEHSLYVNTMNRNIQTFAMRLEEISKNMTVPAQSLWNSLAHVSTHLLVEGFSNAKKCSAGGRALMQLDFTHFMSILELISGHKFEEHRLYVDSYIKAYYFPSDLFEEWIRKYKDRTEYSVKQITNLITCMCGNDKRTRLKLLAIIENATETN